MIPSSRDLVLGRIRSGVGPRRSSDTTALEWRLNGAPRWTRPTFDDNDAERFIAKAEANLSTVESVSSLEAVGPAIDAFLKRQGLPANLSIAPSLRNVSWPTGWQINFGSGRRVERVAITDATAGIAETGSLVICSQAERPGSLNFVPELHVAVLHKADIVHHLEDVWPKVRALPVWPRAVNIISAASRTADVAQIVVRPAHGPKALHIVLVEGDR